MAGGESVRGESVAPIWLGVVVPVVVVCWLVGGCLVVCRMSQYWGLTFFYWRGHNKSVTDSHLERMGQVMNSVYVLRESFDEWVAGAGDISRSDRANVVSWLDTLAADSELWAIVAGMPVMKLVSIVAGE